MTSHDQQTNLSAMTLRFSLTNSQYTSK